MKICYISNSASPSKNASSLQIAKLCEYISKMGHEVKLILPDTGIKMVGIDLPAPPPVVVTRMTSTEAIPATSKVPVVKHTVTMQPEIQSKPSLIPIKASIGSPRSNPTLKNSLANIRSHL